MRSLSATLGLCLLLLGGPAVAEAPQKPEEKERALSALNAARNALRQLDGGGAGGDARAHLDEAERLFAAAKYPEAAARADEAWRLLSAAGAPGTRFRVEVDEVGHTTVSARAGHPVRVEARGVERAVEPGQTVEVPRGAPPSEPRSPPGRPQLAKPAANATLKLRPHEDGRLGPVKLTWKRTEGARAYAVEVVAEDGATEPLRLEAATAALELPRLPPGRYRWTVKALGQAAQSSEVSEARSFRLEAEALKLDVRPPGWK